MQSILAANCASRTCHGNGGDQGGLADLDDYDLAYSHLVNAPSTGVSGMDRVEPFDASNSYLMHKLDGTQTSVGGSGSQMPLLGSPLSITERNGIRAWITAGATKN